MSPRVIVLKARPKARVLYSDYWKCWGVFFDGKPHFIGIHAGYSEADATGSNKTEAWQNALRKLEKASSDPSNPFTPNP